LKAFRISSQTLLKPS